MSMKKVLLQATLFSLLSISTSFAASSMDPYSTPDDARSSASTTTAPSSFTGSSDPFSTFAPPDNYKNTSNQQLPQGQDSSKLQQGRGSSPLQQQMLQLQDLDDQQQVIDAQQQEIDAQQQELDAQKQELDAQQQELDAQQPGFGGQFGMQRQGFGAQQQGFGAQQQGFGAQQQGFGAQQQGFGAQQQGFGAQQQGFGAQQQGFGAQQQGFGTQQQGLAAPQQQDGLGMPRINEPFSVNKNGYATLYSKQSYASKKFPRRTGLKGEPVGPSAVERAMGEKTVTAEKVRPQLYSKGQLTQFGYSFFKSEIPGVASLTDVPVGPDYVIGAGDRLVMTVWGSIDGTFNLVVGRGGEVVLPKVGAVKVAGQNFGQLPALLQGTMARVFKNFNLNVSMGKLRVIKVYVVGEVNAPGDYNVNSLSTLINALSAAGGPTKNGSLRNIQINRNGKVVETIDLYDFFLKGDKGKDIRLQMGDTILVPVIGPVAGIAGNVRRPGIYELKGERTLKDLLILADGINPSGYLQRVQLYRVQAHDKKVVTDFNLDPNGDKTLDQLAGSIAIQDLDFVKVLPIDSVLRGYVRLNGHVLRPGDYALKPGMRLSSILGGDNLLPEYYKGSGQIIRLCPPDQHPEMVVFDVSRALKGEPGYDLELKEFDRVKIFTRREMEDVPFVKVNGEVQKPGQARYLENMTVRDLLMQAGNVKATAYLKNAEITRIKHNGDAVSSYSLPVNLAKALQGGADNIKLEPFDELTVRRIPNWAEATDRYVTLTGEFVFPGTYPIYKGERLSSVVERAGGFTDMAYLRGVKFTREIARKLQQQRMNEALDKAQDDVMKLQATMAQTASTAEDAASAKATLETLMKSIEMLRTKKAEGRMLVEVASLKDLKRGGYNLELQGGDTLSVPRDPGGVNIVGDVYNPNTVVSQKERGVKWYLAQVGGPTGDANLDEVYVVKVDGTVISQKNTSSFLFYNSFWSKILDSGDTVIVPRQYEKTAWLRNIKDVAAIIGNVALTAGVLVAAGL